jgi:hypothetical protein
VELKLEKKFTKFYREVLKNYVMTFSSMGLSDRREEHMLKTIHHGNLLQCKTFAFIRNKTFVKLARMNLMSDKIPLQLHSSTKRVVEALVVFLFKTFHVLFLHLSNAFNENTTETIS